MEGEHIAVGLLNFIIIFVFFQVAFKHSTIHKRECMGNPREDLTNAVGFED